MENKKINMSTIIITLLLLIIVGLSFYIINTQFKSNENKMDILPSDFSENDLIIDNIKIGDNLETVINNLGNYDNKSEYIEGISGENVIELSYDNNQTHIILRSDKVAFISSSATNRIFARNIKIGMSKTEIESLFPENSQTIADTVPNTKLVYSLTKNNDYRFNSYISFELLDNKVISIICSSGDLD